MCDLKQWCYRIAAYFECRQSDCDQKTDPFEFGTRIVEAPWLYSHCWHNFHKWSWNAHCRVPTEGYEHGMCARREGLMVGRNTSADPWDWIPSYELVFPASLITCFMRKCLALLQQRCPEDFWSVYIDQSVLEIRDNSRINQWLFLSCTLRDSVGFIHQLLYRGRLEAKAVYCWTMNPHNGPVSFNQMSSCSRVLLVVNQCLYD